MASGFLEDVRRFGAGVAIMRLDNRRRIQDFRDRQVALAAGAGVFFLFALVYACLALPLTAIAVSCSLGMLLTETGWQEAVRMRQTGRYWRTWVRDPASAEQRAYVESEYICRERQPNAYL